jgi:hypothetical protein
VDYDGDSLPFVQRVTTLTDWPSFQVNQVFVEADPPIPHSESREFVISYDGFLVGYTETGMRYVRDHLDRDFTIIRRDALAFPVLGLPSWRETRTMPDRDFTFRLSVTVPSDLIVATAVPESERTQTGDTSTWVFESRRTVPFLNVSIARYNRLQREATRIFHFPEDSVGARRALAAIERTLERYTGWFGPIDEDAALTVMEIPEGWGSQASLRGGIIQTADAFRDPASLTSLYHEIAHLWHPRDIGRPPVRWTEGLATFLQFRVAEAEAGARSLQQSMETVAQRLLARLAGDSMRASVPMIDYGNRQLTDLSYSTGGLMMYALYRTLGVEAFDTVMASYFEVYRSTGSTTDEFVRHVKQEVDTELSRLFDDWVYTTNWYRRLSAGESLSQIAASYRSS